MKVSTSVKNLITQKITGLTKEQLFLHPEKQKEFSEQITQSLKRLKNWEPIEYIIESAEFYWLDFFVDSRVLIPRNDTEVMVDGVLKRLNWKTMFDLIDVGTGSWCVPISVIKNSKNINKVYSIDISKDALEVVKINIKKHWLENIVQPIESNLLECFLENKKYPLNQSLIITANLPYIKNWDFENMDPEVVKYEPNSALYWGEESGFELYEELIKQCLLLEKQQNIKKLLLFIEIGFDQKEVCEKYLNWLELKFTAFKDNWWIERCVKIEI